MEGTMPTPTPRVLSSQHYINFRNESHESLLLKEMKKLYDEDLLKDMTLCVGDHQFSCHKNVLAATSPYFKLMFTLDLMESRKDSIELFELDARSVKEIIEYAYTGKLKISRLTAQNLLAAASLFQILPVQRACADFMETQLDVSNCIGIHYFAQIHNCHDLKEKSKEFIEKHFSDVCKTDEFLALSFQKITEIISSDELQVEKEETVLQAVLSWVAHDVKYRKDCLSEMLPYVRLGLVHSSFIRENLIKNRLVKNCRQCQQYLKEFAEFETNPSTVKDGTDFNLTLRSGMFKAEQCLLVVGGVEQTGGQPYINCYNPVSQECFHIDDFPESRKPNMYDCEDLACVVTEDDEIFAGGGNYIYHHLFDDSEDDSFEELEYKEFVVQKDFYMFDNDHNKWVSKSPMLFPKSNFTLACLRGKIYCFGGLTEHKNPTEIIEVYDVENNRWNYQGMLPTTLVDLGSVVHQDEIYLLGGRTGVGAHNSLIRYNPETEDWTSLAGMLTPRFNFGACVVDGEIYVAGGQIYSHSAFTINREVLRSVEIYNIESNQWRLGPELPQELYNVGLALISGALYVCGMPDFQQHSPNRYNMVCRLDLGSNQWEVIEDNLCHVRNYRCVMAKMHTRKMVKVLSPSVV